MKDMSYELLDLMEEKGWDEKGLAQILEEGTEPWILEALSPIRENLVDWLDIAKDASVLEIGSGYGALTGILARKAGSVDVVDEREENLETGRRRWGQMENIRWHLKETGTERVYDWVFLIGPGLWALYWNCPAGRKAGTGRKKKRHI